MRSFFLALAAILALAVSAAALNPGQSLLLVSGGIKPAVFTDFTQTASTLPSANYTYAGTSLRTITDATGNITSASNEALLNNASLSTQGVTVSPAWNYMLDCYGSGSITLSGASTGTLACGGASQTYTKITAPTAGTLTLTVSGTVTNAHLAALTYETTPRPGDQVVTTSAAFYGPAFDYDPVTHAPLGLRIEESRTNSILNSTMQGAVVGTPGTLPNNWNIFSLNGITMNVVGAGVYNGMNTVDLQFVGTPNKTYQVIAFDISITASPGQVWSQGMYAAIVGGSLTNINNIYTELRPGQTGAVADTAMTLTSSLSRQPTSVLTLPAGNTTIYPSLQIATTISSPINITIRIGAPQLELGSFATSYTPTSASSVTRAADVVSLTGQALATLRGGAGAVVAELNMLENISVNRVIGYNGGSNTPLFVNSSTTVGAYNTTNSVTTTGGVGNLTTGKARAGYSLSYSIGIISFGGSIPTVHTLTFPSVTSVELGSDGGNPLRGYITKLALYNRALSPSQLQRRTVLGAQF